MLLLTTIVAVPPLNQLLPAKIDMATVNASDNRCVEIQKAPEREPDIKQPPRASVPLPISR